MAGSSQAQVRRVSASWQQARLCRCRRVPATNANWRLRPLGSSPAAADLCSAACNSCCAKRAGPAQGEPLPSSGARIRKHTPGICKHVQSAEMCSWLAIRLRCQLKPALRPGCVGLAVCWRRSVQPVLEALPQAQPWKQERPESLLRQLAARGATERACAWGGWGLAAGQHARRAGWPAAHASGAGRAQELCSGRARVPDAAPG